MENLRRNIKLFFAKYGSLIFYAIGTIFIIYSIIQWLNNMVIEDTMAKDVVLTEEEKVQIQVQEKQKNEDIQVISKFIEHCNKREIEFAYDMLSEKCKKEKYSTLQIFNEEYINKVFKIEICEYSVEVEENKYKVTLTQSMIATGKRDSTLEETYILEGILDRKIYILN